MTLPEDGLGTGAEHLMQGETVEIDVWPGRDGPNAVRVECSNRITTIVTRAGAQAAIGRCCKPNTTTVVRWHGGERLACIRELNTK